MLPLKKSNPHQNEIILGFVASAVMIWGQSSGNAIAIVGGNLIDVRKGVAIEQSVVLAAGDRITAVGRVGELAVPSGAKIVDAQGKWLIPGLVDMHVHVSSHVAGVPGYPWLIFYLANGVTTIRDTGGNITSLRVLRQDLNSGHQVGPRLFLAGMILDGNPAVSPGPHVILADSEQRAESAVNFWADQGVDFIKVYNNISEPVLVTILKTAHARGLTVTGHVPRSVTTTRAVELGMDGLEHIRITGRELLPIEEANKIDFLTLGSREPLLWQRFDTDSIGMNKLIGVIAGHHTFLDPTLVVDEATFKMTAEERSGEPNNRMLPKALLKSMLEEDLPDSWLPPKDLRTAAAEGFSKRLKFVEMCYRAGVRLLAGTDGPGLGPTLPGYGLHSEMELLEAAGIPPIDVLRAATITAAEALNAQQNLGAIEPGKLADIVIVDADPLRDIANTRYVYRVVKGSEIYDPQELITHIN
ncbi:MAG: amidohydrolase family protein [Bryobacteraceae bacterium]|jgi:imidazolonepropionase-like amidohydrolase